MGTLIINMKNKAYDALVMGVKDNNKARKGLKMLGHNFREWLEKASLRR